MFSNRALRGWDRLQVDRFALSETHLRLQPASQFRYYLFYLAPARTFVGVFDQKLPFVARFDYYLDRQTGDYYERRNGTWCVLPRSAHPSHYARLGLTVQFSF